MPKFRLLAVGVFDPFTGAQLDTAHFLNNDDALDFAESIWEQDLEARAVPPSLATQAMMPAPAGWELADTGT